MEAVDTVISYLKEQRFLGIDLWLITRIILMILIIAVVRLLLCRVLKVAFRKLALRRSAQAAEADGPASDAETDDGAAPGSAFDRPIDSSTFFLALSIGFHILREWLRSSRPIDLTLGAIASSLYILSIAVIAYTFIPAILRLTASHPKVALSRRSNRTVIHYVSLLIRVAVILFAVFAILTVWGINVSGFIAGLGVGGLAISLAAKDTLSNLIGGMTIMIDHPFEIGEVIRVGDNEGTVEDIGFRSTRLRTYDMMQVIIPNSMVVNDSLVNISRLTARRIRIEIAIDPTTSSEAVEELLSQLEQIVQQRPLRKPDGVQVTLAGLSGIAQNILVQYYIDSTDYTVFLDEQRSVLLKINELMIVSGIKGADPLGVHLSVK